MTAAVAAPINLCWSGVQARGLRARVNAQVPGGEDQARVADHPGPVGLVKVGLGQFMPAACG